MKKSLAWILAFCLMASLAEARPKKAPAGGALSAESGQAQAVAPAVASEEETEVTLKDGQSMKGTVAGYDSYLLDMKSARGVLFHLPWIEISSVTRQSVVQEWSLTYLSPGKNITVNTMIAPVSGAAAFRGALFPGILLHGWGHMKARDTDRFYALMGAEVFGLMVGAFGVAEMSGPKNEGETDDTARALAWGGGSVFVASWLWDLAFASSAADRFNKEHNLALNLAPINNGMLLGMNYKF